MAKEIIKMAELFAGVGGFRLGLEGFSDPNHPEFNMPAAGPFKTVWANQWEPDGSVGKQFAWRCYESHFGEGSCVNADIHAVLDDFECGKCEIPDFELLVGGFPCQDYSVAKPLTKAKGIEGKKGVLWWDILRMVRLKHPRYLLLENVDRLLKSPVNQRGRDFAVMLSCLMHEGYSVEWRVINAADYGMPQRRRRVYIFAETTNQHWDLEERLCLTGVIASAFPINDAHSDATTIELSGDPYMVSNSFGIGERTSPFQNAGVMQNGTVFTMRVEPSYDGPRTTLGDIVISDSDVPEQFFIEESELPKWEYLRSAKREPRTTSEGFEYIYTEGAMAWPDPLDRPARTILTGEGGKGASRMKHAIMGDSGRIRRLVPDELDQIQMFPRGWTKSEGDRRMSDAHRAFCMGNALVVGIPHRIGVQIANLQQGKSNEIRVEEPLRVVDLFCGCGGMSLGFQKAGFNVVAAFDKWAPALAVYRKNFDHEVFESDLGDPSTIQDIASFSPDIIIGGPPCQDFSTAGLQNENGGRAVLSIAFANIIASTKPRWFVMENVATIRNTQSFQSLCEILHNAGYGLTCKILNAAYCGVPQTRKRMFIIGGLGESEEFLENELAAGLSEKPMTIRDYLGDSLGIEHYFRVPTNYSRRGVFSIDEPSMTVRAIDRPIPPGYKGHPNDSAPVSETRVLTPKERSYIQTFPEEFDFFGGKSDVNTMIGNAVPVNLAFYVASRLRNYIDKHGACDE